MRSHKPIEKWLPEVLEKLKGYEKRIAVGVLAREYGEGGISKIARASGLSWKTVQKAVKELDEGFDRGENQRSYSGGHRPSALETDPNIQIILQNVINIDTWEAASSPILWTSRGLRELNKVLRAEGHNIHEVTVSKVLALMGYRQQNILRKLPFSSEACLEAQLRYLTVYVNAMRAKGVPVVAITAKKERNQPFPYNSRDKDWNHEKNIKSAYGLYWKYWVDIDQDHITAGVAASLLVNWWLRCKDDIKKFRIMICPEMGYNDEIWRETWIDELQQFANRSNIWITVCHVPNVTRKWRSIDDQVSTEFYCKHDEQHIRHSAVLEVINSKSHTNVPVSSSPWVDKINTDEQRPLVCGFTPHEFNGRRNYDILPIVNT